MLYSGMGNSYDGIWSLCMCDYLVLNSSDMHRICLRLFNYRCVSLLHYKFYNRLPWIIGYFTSCNSSHALPSKLNDSANFVTQYSYLGWPCTATADKSTSPLKSICKNCSLSWTSGIQAPFPCRRACPGSWNESRMDEAVTSEFGVQKLCSPRSLLHCDHAMWTQEQRWHKNNETFILQQSCTNKCRDLNQLIFESYFCQALRIASNDKIEAQV